MSSNMSYETVRVKELRLVATKIIFDNLIASDEITRKNERQVYLIHWVQTKKNLIIFSGYKE